MKRIYLLLAILLGSLQLANAQQQTLQFNKDGKFKIVQFTDVHYIYNDPRSDVSIERINQVLDMEKPDLVLFTGDVIYGKLFPLWLFVRSYSHGLTVPYTHQYSRVSTLEGYQAT